MFSALSVECNSPIPDRNSVTIAERKTNQKLLQILSWERVEMYWSPLELDNLIEETCLYRHTSQQVRITVTHPEVIDR